MEIIKKTILKDEKYLRQISKEVDFNDLSYLDDIKILNEFCDVNPVFAMAAVQIGIPKRIIYLKHTSLEESLDSKSANPLVLINPTVISRKGHTKYWEACASCLDNMGLVNRPYMIEFEYYDKDARKHHKIFEGFEATVLSHEFDHLDGVLHIDIAEQIIIMAAKERPLFRETHNYMK